ncbi:MAG TPA: DUF1592 domain-containing protein [Polyangiaceae bacterium]
MRFDVRRSLIGELCVLSGIFVLSGCEGEVVEPTPTLVEDPPADSISAGASGQSQASGAGGRASSSSGAGGGGRSSTSGGTSPGTQTEREPPATSFGTFARLTRAEYASTVRAAFGIDVDLSILPSDGRTGPFTSNATADSDPVHPYLLAAEQIAAAVVPEHVQACTGAAAGTCVRQNLGAPLATLYRRPLSDAELTGSAAFVQKMTAEGSSDVEATRALVTSALLSPDFLFRAALAAGDTTAHGRRVAERLSFALWDSPPDSELASALGSASAGKEVAWAAHAGRLARDARAIPVFARFLAQWLHLDLDLRLADAAFARTPRYLEFMAFVEDALRNDVPVTELLTGKNGFVHRDNADAYGIDLASGDASVVPVTWPNDSARRGVLGQDLLADSTRHPDRSRRWIFRGRLVRSFLLCNPIPSPSAELIALSAEVKDRLTDPRCSSCHSLMDPIGKAFDGLDPDASGASGPAEVLAHPELEGSYADLPALLEAISGSRAFAECFSKHWLSFFLDQSPTDVDGAWVAQLADAVQSGAGLRALAEKTTVTLETTTRAATPWCSGS